MHLPIFEATWQACRPALPTGRHRWHGHPQPVTRSAFHRHGTDAPTEEIPVTTPDEPVSATAGEQDHEDPWAYAGDDVDAPVSTADDEATGGRD